MEKMKYYSLDKILKENADYNIIYGERSNGKTTAVLSYALQKFVESNYIDQLAIVRRMEMDFKGKNGSAMFDGIINLGWVDKFTKGLYNSIYYYSSRWYLCKVNEVGKRIETMEKPFAYAFALSQQEHYKSTSYSNIRYILFDEFLTNTYFLPDEFVIWQNLLSTIIRQRDNVKIFMCGNNISKYAIYWREMGVTNIKKQEQGTIDVYTYGDSKLKVAVEYSTSNHKAKKSNKYFAFNNSKLQMITNGGWEINIHPHLPVKYRPKDVKYYYFIEFDNEKLKCEIVNSKELKMSFTYIHRWTRDFDNKHIVFNLETIANRNYRRNIKHPFDDVGKIIYSYYQKDLCFYQDNDVGELVANYLKCCI